MAKTILVNAGAGETRVAIVEDGVLQAFVFEYTIGVGDDRPQGAAGRRARPRPRAPRPRPRAGW